MSEAEKNLRRLLSLVNLEASPWTSSRSECDEDFTPCPVSMTRVEWELCCDLRRLAPELLAELDRLRAVEQAAMNLRDVVDSIRVNALQSAIMEMDFARVPSPISSKPQV